MEPTGAIGNNLTLNNQNLNPSSKSLLPLIFGAFILIVLSSLGTYLVLSSKKEKPVPVSQNITPTPIPTVIQENPTVVPTEKVDETKDWKVYKASEYEVKYPNNWSYQETQSTYVRFQKGEFKKELPTSETYISISRKENPKKLSLDQWLKEENILIPNSDSKMPATDVKIDNITGKQFISQRDDGGKIIYLAYQNYVFQITNVLMGENIEESKNVFDKMLSTFKFLE